MINKNDVPKFDRGEKIAGRLCDWDFEGEPPVPLMQEAAAYIREELAASIARECELMALLERLRAWMHDLPVPTRGCMLRIMEIDAALGQSEGGGA